MWKGLLIMGWHYQHPDQFPSFFHSAMRLAHQSPEEKILLSKNRSYHSLKRLQGEFNRFRWCLRQTHSSPLFHIEESNIIRTRIICDDPNSGYWNLWLTVRTKPLLDLEASAA